VKPRSCKAKGKRLTNQIALDIVKRLNLQSGDAKAPPTSCPGEDVWLSPTAQAAFPFSIEAKNVEKLNVWTALKQCEANAGDLTPLLIIKRNRSKTYAVLLWDELLDILVEILEMRGKNE